MLSSIISNNKDIFINSDTKLNESFQINQLLFRVLQIQLGFVDQVTETVFCSTQGKIQ